MKIKTTRFGEIELTEAECIQMKGSILGFEPLRRFALLLYDDKTPLCWLQSFEDPSLAFVVIDPLVVKPDYKPAVLTSDLDFLEIKDKGDMVLLSIVTIRSEPFRITANLRAPLIINAVNRTAKQAILENADFPIQYDVLDHKADCDLDFSAHCKSLSGLNKLAFTVAAP